MYSMGSPTATGAGEVNNTPEELTFFVSPIVLTLAEPTIWNGRRRLNR